MGRAKYRRPSLPAQSVPAPSPAPPRGEISEQAAITRCLIHCRPGLLSSFAASSTPDRPTSGRARSWTSASYGDAGVFLGVANTHTFNQDWFAATAAGTSVGGFYLPRFRANATVSRKWLPARQLVTSVGGGYYAAKDAHRDYSVAAGAVYYFPAAVIVEGGVTWNHSTPGGVASRYQFFAVTQGRERERYIVVRVAGGNEAYQLIGPTSPIANFASRSASLTVRQWVNSAWGLSLGAEIYSNSSYTRSAVTLGAFKQF